MPAGWKARTLVHLASGGFLDAVAVSNGTSRAPGETDDALRDRLEHKTYDVTEEELTKKEGREMAATGSAILERAFEGGFFDIWKENVWQRADRDALRAAARGLLGADYGCCPIRLEVRGRDSYPEGDGLPLGDWEHAKGAKLVRVYIVESST